jgi:hypothetical protein
VDAGLGTVVGRIGTLTGEGPTGATSSGAGTLTEGTKAAAVALDMGASTTGFAGAAAGIEVTTRAGWVFLGPGTSLG